MPSERREGEKKIRLAMADKNITLIIFASPQSMHRNPWKAILGETLVNRICANAHLCGFRGSTPVFPQSPTRQCRAPTPYIWVSLESSFKTLDSTLP